ncbi:hypothetical protein [Bradyrhizobium sp. CCGUVB23]|uniref:hypothetical protein n=1 Tax=Bradyrhizobium sp. CCGUVB23 TaxID=2949630 RepID=UPI0020B1F6CD|nr:hypothetical protein [Bradyrhizobium sp. CCGUVB23]MCP3459750.1 hypothetical protein [Bradyrhizobium sp. CCGUVB23]
MPIIISEPIATTTGQIKRQLFKLTPSLQIDLTKIHCVHLRYSILARHQIAAEPAFRFCSLGGD